MHTASKALLESCVAVCHETDQNKIRFQSNLGQLENCIEGEGGGGAFEEVVKLNWGG